MNRSRIFFICILVLSLIVNGLLGFHVYKNSRILQMQSNSYNRFKEYLNNAVKETDKLKHDQPGSADMARDAISANRDLEAAVGVIWGLRTDFAKKGMDIYPIFLGLMDSENFNPYDLDFKSKETLDFINKNSKRLHDLKTVLGPTTFSNSGIKKLQKAVVSLYGKYDGYPSYSKLQ